VSEGDTGGHEGSIFDALDDAPCSDGTIITCTTSCSTPGDSTCVSGEFGKCKPRPGDTCTGLDCTGKGDGVEHVYFLDGDGDGHGVASSTVAACTVPSGYASKNDDCDDSKASIHPGAPEACDLIDNDCNTKCDDGAGCRIGIHRAAKPGEHFWSATLSEAGCCGFTVERANDYYIYAAATAGAIPWYRCVSTKHLYTTSPTCEGLTSEGLMGYIGTAASCGSVPLYRAWNPSGNDHLWTTSTVERASVLSAGWVDEGIVGYVWLAPSG
jgi:hypothetical protein